MVGKIHAAVDTRQDPDMVIIARSDARAIEGLQASIDRVNAYLEAGADVGFVEAPQNIEELRIVAREVAGPALVNVFEGGKTPMVPASELEAMGFRLGIYPSQTHRAAIRAAQKVLAALKEDGDTSRIEGDLATFQEREDAVGTARWRALEEKYMRGVEPSPACPPSVSRCGRGASFPRPACGERVGVRGRLHHRGAATVDVDRATGHIGGGVGGEEAVAMLANSSALPIRPIGTPRPAWAMKSSSETLALSR